MNGPGIAPVQAELDVSLIVPGDEPVPLPVSLRYDPSDPYAVTATFRTGQGEGVSWVFARELLAVGLHRPIGDGDVQVSPGHRGGERVAEISLRSPDGSALLHAPANDLVVFLGRTYTTVPDGTETDHLDIDRELERMMQR